MKTLSDILDQDFLRDLAGDRYFERGVDYFERGLVHSLAQYDECLSAEVYGTETYQVQLWLKNDDLHARCTCPLGVEDLFCKHCVAVGLAWIDEPPPYSPSEKMPAKVGTTMEDVRDYLARQERETLVRMILEQAMEDARWRDRLLMKAASHQTGGVDINTFKRTLRNAIAIGDFVDYYEAESYADHVQTAIDGLEELLEAGYATDVVELSEEAIMLLDDALNSVDDSDGNLNLILDQVQELHYQSCEEAQPNPQALAERLFHMEMKSEFGFFSNALESYADILGDEGREAYGQLVDAEWKKQSNIGEWAEGSFNYRRRKLNRMKETLVEAQGNREDLVAVIAADLSNPSRYLKIVQLYQDAGQEEKAIDWAEQGIEAFKEDHYIGDLGNFLVTAYEKQSRFEDAVFIIWQDFSARPSRYLYQKLKQQAEKADNWTEWRDQALTHLRQSAEQRKQTRRAYPFGYAHANQSLLVEILLWEGNIDQAWQEAQAGGCSKNLWMHLADMRAAKHPEESLDIYKREIETLINKTDNQSYHQAVDLIVKVKDLMIKLDQEAEFQDFLETLRSTYKRKRNFIKFLQQVEV